MKIIVVVWLDGTEEAVHCLYHNVRNGILSLEVNRHEWRQIPLTAIREWRSAG